jgi:hypothetical protein
MFTRDAKRKDRQDHKDDRQISEPQKLIGKGKARDGAKWSTYHMSLCLL